MSVMKKTLTTVAMAASLLAGAAHAEDVRIALVVKALGIGFFEAAAKGAEEAAAELGDVEIIECDRANQHCHQNRRRNRQANER